MASALAAHLQAIGLLCIYKLCASRNAPSVNEVGIRILISPTKLFLSVFLLSIPIQHGTMVLFMLSAMKSYPVVYHIHKRLRRELRRQDGGGSGSGSGSGSVAVVAVAVAQSLEGRGRGVR